MQVCLLSVFCRPIIVSTMEIRAPTSSAKNEKMCSKSVKIDKKLGRSKKEEPLETGYFIEAEVEIDNDSILKKRQKLGRFVLADQ